MKLTRRILTQGLANLTERDKDLARIFEEHGPPPLWPREPGFHTLIYIMLEQQVSLASAAAAYNRLLKIASPLTPARFLELDDTELKAAAFSRQKMVYGRHLAESITDGSLDVDGLQRMKDDDVRRELLKIKGIGHWTAEIYLLRALMRPDAWPVGDLALQVAAQEVKRLATRPGPEELEAIGRAWQPWRAIAARLLWVHYLNRPKGLRRSGVGEPRSPT